MKQFLLAVSLLIKSVILLFLPFVIFALLYGSCIQFAKNATRILLQIIFLVCLSNLLTTALGCAIGKFVYSMPLAIAGPVSSASLTPLFTIPLRSPIGSVTALFLGIILGIFLPRYSRTFAHRCGEIFDQFLSVIMRTILALLPIFIFGFLIKLKHDGIIATMAADYISVFSIIIIIKFSYIFLLYFWLGDFHWDRFRHHMANMFPAIFCGFSSMSSAATLPVTLAAVERNAKDKILGRSVVPLTVNIHLIGNNFAIPILAFALLKSYGIPFPTFCSVLLFIGYSVITKFSVVAVPGGGIIVMLPILEHFLGFDGTMCSTIFAIYLLFNPILTVSNILGNGAFALLAEKFIAQKKC
jgi:Na+/H+-dicarboxylate symporter